MAIDRIGSFAVALGRRLQSEESAQTMVEYVLILAAIAIVCMAAFGGVASAVTSELTAVVNAM
jgi:Flp pilus assembly pilin Flp